MALVEVENAHAEGVLAVSNSAFETVLIENISDKLIAFTADGASVNMGSEMVYRLDLDSIHYTS